MYHNIIRYAGCDCVLVPILCLFAAVNASAAPIRGGAERGGRLHRRLHQWNPALAHQEGAV